MNKVFISRADGNIPWGFRLQGGLEDNAPLTLTNIQPNSPADGKINSGYVLIEIAGTNVTQMTHKDAIELIRSCGDALFLTIGKVGQSFEDIDGQLSSSLSPPPVFDGDSMDHTAASFNNSPTVPYEQTMDFSSMPAVLVKTLGRPGGPKPFTYTPGKVNLSEILQSAVRDRRQRLSRSISETDQNIESIMNRRMIVPPEQMNQHHYAGTTPITPFSYARQQPTSPKKQSQHDTDVITQSRSFQLLEDWITDSEKTVAALVPPSTSSSSTVTRTSHDDEIYPARRTSGPTSLPSRSFRYLQEQYSVDEPPNFTTNTTTPRIVDQTFSPRDHGGLRRSSDAHTPSRAFKYLQDQYPFSQQLSSPRSESVNNREDLVEIYHKLPASFRAREPEAPRYTGSAVPSRSFRFLQKMTSEDEQSNPDPVSGYVKPHQHLPQKYEQSTSINNNVDRFHEHPSRSFKYLQEMTGEHAPSGKYHPTDKQSTNNVASSDF